MLTMLILLTFLIYFSGTLALDKACPLKPMDLIFVLDGSDSEGQENFNKQLAFVANYTHQFEIGQNKTRVSVVTFSSEVKNEFYLDRYYDNSSLTHAIEQTHYLGQSTFTHLALDHVRQQSLSPNHGAERDVSKLVCVLTDGMSIDHSATITAAIQLKKHPNVTVVAIGIGIHVDYNELLAIASDANHTFRVANFDALSSIKAELTKKTCSVIVDGSWSPWSPWSQCDVTCAHGHIHRTRTCTNPSPALGGQNCFGSNQENRVCNLAKCPGVWSPWFNDQCSVTCGNGTMTRVRRCSTGHVEDCVGNSSEIVHCQDMPCKVDGSWSSWSPWSHCDVTCAHGHIHRTRTCTNPAPALGGQNCSGVSHETSTCTLAQCPSWSKWFLGDCSVTCGNGTLSRMRMCSSGHDEDCPGSAIDTVPCSKLPC
ncbi:coadhesin-like isoform X3 [Dreissena polymorpha]|uniref:coadhesin-like isoform X3 n=1 Tax=Dreissena polymorpha TaxID=45954 RepID=UPI0022645F21|nr:coadhesin-like isoform X3 [Dreissena polymorpha]